jgi:hypothetical protein
LPSELNLLENNVGYTEATFSFYQYCRARALIASFAILIPATDHFAAYVWQLKLSKLFPKTTNALQRQLHVRSAPLSKIKPASTSEALAGAIV